VQALRTKVAAERLELGRYQQRLERRVARRGFALASELERLANIKAEHERSKQLLAEAEASDVDGD
jgi:hypothetical protein